MPSKNKQRTPPDLMSELLGSLQEDTPLPGESQSTATKHKEDTKQQDAKATSLLVDKETSRVVDLSTRPQTLKTHTRKRDGEKLTRKTHYLAPGQVQLLKEYAFMTNTGESEVVRQALNEFFERHGSKAWNTTKQ